MNYFIKEILVILDDCKIYHLLIGGSSAIYTKTRDKIISPVRVGKMVKKPHVVSLLLPLISASN
jgi:hypothetical protein